MRKRNTGIEARRFLLFLISDDGEGGFQVRGLFQVLESLKEEVDKTRPREADRIISMASPGGVTEVQRDLTKLKLIRG